jgi:hypothetical protein
MRRSCPSEQSARQANRHGRTEKRPYFRDLVGVCQHSTGHHAHRGAPHRGQGCLALRPGFLTTGLDIVLALLTAETTPDAFP